VSVTAGDLSCVGEWLRTEPRPFIRPSTARKHGLWKDEEYLGKGDADRAHEMYHDDAVLEFPQSWTAGRAPSGGPRGVPTRPQTRQSDAPCPA
jgi:hypothetical protein